MATKQCVVCGKRITEKSTVCPYCGESQDKNISNETRQEISTESGINENMTVCKTCGKQVSKNAKICPHCGEVLLVPEPKKKKTSLITWLVLLLFVGYIVGEVGDKSKKNSYTSDPSSKRTTTKSTNHRGGGCSVGDFTIRQSAGWMEGGYYKVPFSVINNCAKSAGVEIQMSFYAKDNTLLNAMTGWPASVSNIPSGETYNDVWLERVDQDVERVTFKAVDVKVWR